MVSVAFQYQILSMKNIDFINKITPDEEKECFPQSQYEKSRYRKDSGGESEIDTLHQSPINYNL